MNNKRMRIIVGFLTACLVALLSANAQGDKTKVKGLITARTGDTIILKTTDGGIVSPSLWMTTPRCSNPRGLECAKNRCLLPR